MANPQFEKPVAERTQARCGNRVCRGRAIPIEQNVSPAIGSNGGEGLIDKLDPAAEQQHYLFPVIWESFPRTRYNFGVGRGLTRGSDRVIVKFYLELERFIGSVFKASREDGWFF